MNFNEVMEVLRIAAEVNEPVLIEGEPGAGKTQAPRLLAQELGLPYYEIRAAEFDSIDFRGAMVPKDGKVTWLAADIWPTEKCVINFDEISQADSTLTSPLLKVFSPDRAIGNVKLHPETILIATGNRVQDRAGSQRLSTALRSRCTTVTLVAEPFTWVKWARAESAKTGDKYLDLTASYIQDNPTFISRFDPKSDAAQPNPRSWVRAAKFMSRTKNRDILASVVGLEAANHYVAWVAEHETQIQLPKVADVIAGTATAPDDATLFVEWSEKLVEYAVAVKDDSCSIELQNIELGKVVDLLKTLPDTFVVSALRSLGQRDKNYPRGARVLDTPPMMVLVSAYRAKIISASQAIS